MFINNLSFLNFPFLGRGGGKRPKIGSRDQVHIHVSGSWIRSKMGGWVGGGLCLAHFLIDLKSCVSSSAQPPRPGMYGKYEIR